jgi:hypothetical protein
MKNIGAVGGKIVGTWKISGIKTRTKNSTFIF